MLVFTALTACHAVPSEGGAPAGAAALGDRAIDFTLEGSDGQPIRLSAYAGDVILLDLSGFH